MGKRNRHSHEGVEDRRQQKQQKKLDKSAVVKSEATTTNFDDVGSKSKLSVFQKLQIELTVSILPSGLRDVSSSINDSMRQFLLRYSTALGGVPLAFNDIKLLKNGKGSILNELPYVHYTVACNATIFAPSAGRTLRGIVRKSFHSHLSLVVLNYFNASISADALHAQGFTYHADEEQWKDEECNVTLALDDKVEFQVVKVHESAGIISIEGAFPSRMQSV
jgi:DNA-directed RNA polymerase subunit E'/Rpb7